MRDFILGCLLFVQSLKKSYIAHEKTTLILTLFNKQKYVFRIRNVLCLFGNDIDKESQLNESPWLAEYI